MAKGTTHSATKAEALKGRRWWLVDANDQTVGRIATRIASILKGKHKPLYTPSLDTGDFVVVVNAGKVALSGNKRQQAQYHRHSGFPGGLRSTSYGELLDTRPQLIVERAIRGMLPKNKLGRAQASKLKVYAGPVHPHEAQQPAPFEIVQVAQ